MKITKSKKEILDFLLTMIAIEYDISEGSLFYDILAPVSIELSKVYDTLEQIKNNAYADTASGEALDKIAMEVGIYRKQATFSHGIVTIHGKPGTTIPRYTKVASDEYIFYTEEHKTVQDNGFVEVPISSEIAGKMYNLPPKTIIHFPVVIPNLTAVTNENALVGGYDGETDEELRERYYFKVREPVTSGNVYHYKKWCLEVEGVGGVKVFPLWNGAGTVKVVIVDKNIQSADDELLGRARNYLEEVRPIGATVTVNSATSKNISVVATVKVGKNINFDEIKNNFESALKEHFKKVGFKQNYVSYAQICNLLLNTFGVMDYSNLKINNNTLNITLAEEEIPKLTDVTLTKEVV